MAELEQNDLSEREIEILKLVATGVSNKEIAHKLVISPNTVKVHLRNIFTKTGAVSRTEAAMYAVNNGLVETSSMMKLNELDNPTNSSQKPIIFSFEWLKRNSVILILGFVIIIILILILRQSLFQAEPESISSPQPSNIDTNWKTIEQMPVPRYAFASTVYEKHIYILGGVSDSGITDSVVSFDIESNQWHSQVSLLLPVSEIKATIINGKIYVPGGKTTSGKTTNRLQVFDILSGLWSDKTPLPIALSGYAMANMDGVLYIFGGWDGSDILDTVFSYNPDTDQWTLRANIGVKRVYAEAVSVSNKILVIGGFDGKRPLDLTDAYIPQNDVAGINPWQSKTTLPKPLFGMGAISIGDFVYIAGGANNDELLFYSDAQNLWQIVNVSTNLENEFPGLLASGNSLYFFGGRNQANDPITQSVTYQALFIVQMPIIVR